MQYKTLNSQTQYNTLNCKIIQYNVTQYNTIQCNTIQYIQCNSTPGPREGASPGLREWPRGTCCCSSYSADAASALSTLLLLLLSFLLCCCCCSYSAANLLLLLILLYFAAANLIFLLPSAGWCHCWSTHTTSLHQSNTCYLWGAFLPVYMILYTSNRHHQRN